MHRELKNCMSNEIPSEIQTPEREVVAPVDHPQRVLESSKSALSDVWCAFKLVWQDPANGFQDALLALGDARAFRTGMILCITFILAGWIVILKAVNLLAGFIGLLAGGFGGTFFSSISGQLDISDHLCILLSLSAPVVGLAVILWGIKNLFKGVGTFKHFTFVTGVALIPITFFLLLLWLLGNNSVELITLTALFCFTAFILLLNASLMSVMRLSSRNALLLVPVLLVADLFVARVAFEILY
jgi:hypothetical protein